MSLVVMPNFFTTLLLHNLAIFNDGDYYIALFKNNWTPAITDDISDYDPADFGGYAGSFSLTMWTAGTYSSPRYPVTHPAITWTANGASTNTIYGYFVYDATLNKLAFAERRTSGGVVIGTAAGQQYIVVPQYTRRSEFG